MLLENSGRPYVDDKIFDKFIVDIDFHLRKMWREVLASPHFSVKEKTGFRDIVTSLDVEVENHLKELLHGILPGAGFFGEETSRNPSDKLNWIIDPIDGTTNFSRANPHFSTQIALAKGQQVYIGIIYDPNLNEFFHAIKGKGSFLNGRSIGVSGTGSIREASINTGLQYASGKAYERLVERIGMAIRECRSLRIAGSACLDLAYVACGRTDIYWEEAIKPWDVAAGTLLVSEAGGKIESSTEESFDLYNPNILASNGNRSLLEEVKKLVIFAQ